MAWLCIASIQLSLFPLTYIGPQLRLDFTIVIVMTAFYIKPRTPRNLMSTLVLSYLWATSDFLPALWATCGLEIVSVIYIYRKRDIYIYTRIILLYIHMKLYMII